MNGCNAREGDIPSLEVVLLELLLSAGAVSIYPPDRVRSGPPTILLAVNSCGGVHMAAALRPRHCPRAGRPRMALWYSRIVSACSRLKWGRGVPRPVWSPGVGQAAPTAMGGPMPALAAPKFDVGSSYRLAPEWG